MSRAGWLTKKIKFWFKSFSLKELGSGLGVTHKKLVDPKITIQFPEERSPQSPRFRGLHALMRYDGGQERCIACKLCESVCPANAITIEAEEVGPEQRRTTRYDIDLFKCIYCGFCEEACPVDAIVETSIYDFHFESRENTVINKEQLLTIGDRYQDQIRQTKEKDARYR